MCMRAAPALLSHVNLLLTLYGGASLATAARLKWDPSTYVVVRELFPAEYRAAAAALTAGGAAMLLLPHLATAAQHASKPRTQSVLLYMYAGLMTLLMLGELVFSAWLALQAAAWLRSEAALQMMEALQLSEHLRPLLHYLARWHPLPHRIDALIEEAKEDAPRNAYAALGLGALLALLQLLAAVLALLSARSYHRQRHSDSRSESELPLQPRPPSYNSASSYDYQKMPRTAYRNGRIVILGRRP